MSLRVLLLENIHAGAVTALQAEGHYVHVEKGAFSDAQLTQELKKYDVLGVRSKTHISAAALAANPHLLAIGAFCIGTNQIDLDDANLLGIPVFNAPYSNTRSVAELVLAEMIALSRHLGDVNTAAHRGDWLKSASGAHEVRGRTLGIVGYGHIGSQVSVLAEGLGLRVIYYDIVKKLPIGNARSTDSLKELLENSDFVTLHVPETELTQGMIGADELALMRKSACLLNASRGSVVDIKALAAVIRSGHLAGAAIDVFPEEPKNNEEPFVNELQGLRNVILTPHIGGSTEEAQEAIGFEVSTSLNDFMRDGMSLGAVNFPQLGVPPRSAGVRLINVHKNVPGVLGELNAIVSKAGVNIRSQYLSTDNRIGYVVVDLEGAQNPTQLENDVANLKTSIKTRIVKD